MGRVKPGKIVCYANLLLCWEETTLPTLILYSLSAPDVLYAALKLGIVDFFTAANG